MTVQSSESSHPLLSCTDGIAASTTDIFLLVGRVLIGWLFLASSWGKLANIAGFEGYLTALKAPAPGIMAWIGASVEFLIGATLIRGVHHLCDRAGAPLLGIPARSDGRATNELPQKSGDPGRHATPVRDRTGPLQHRSDPVEDALTAPADRQFHNSLLARHAPCASASSFAHMIDGCTRR
jgi:hypothetical protein